MEEQTLVLIKPDGVAKGLVGHVLTDLQTTGLKLVAIKIVDVQREIAEMHYQEHKGKPFFEKVIEHLIGKYHKGARVIAMVYKGEDAIQKIRTIAGATNPEKAEFHTIRGKYGRITKEPDCIENVIHTSDSPDSAKREIALWFKKDELLD